MNLPTREYGYILIDTPELKAKFAPKLPDDQFWVRESLWQTVGIDGKCSPEFTDYAYRRRIDPGDGFEIVPANETVVGNEVFDLKRMNWRPTGFHQFTAKRAFECDPEIAAFRRRIQKQPRRFWAVLAPNNYFLFDSQERAEHFSQLHANPPPVVALTETDPPPEKSPAELAWELWDQSHDPKPSRDGTRYTFLAGYEAGRAAK